MTGRDCVFYDGPSALTGAPILGIITGLEYPSHNPKTGPLAQVWILRADLLPMDAKRQNLDDAICGDCPLRGEGGFGAACYVTPWLGPAQVYKRYRRGDYARIRPGLLVDVWGATLRLGAYGDPAAIPYDTWNAFLPHVRGWIGYTHLWRTCDPRFREWLMASVETVADADLAQARGWRTFRVRGRHEALQPDEFACPASRESGHRTTCEQCQLCGGLSTPARSVAIMAHGKPGNMIAFRALQRREARQ